MLFKNSVRTSKRTPHFTITKINWLTLFKFNRAPGKIKFENIKQQNLYVYADSYRRKGRIKVNFRRHQRSSRTTEMLGEISDSHGSQCEDDGLLGYRAIQSRRNRPTFQRCILPISEWRCRQYASLKRWSTSTRLYSVIPQKCLVNRRRTLHLAVRYVTLYI
jgi:hypothetical protein